MRPDTLRAAGANEDARRDASRLALGTAQLGGGYGYARVRAPSLREVAAIVRLARQWHVDVIDTAAAYGDSEMNLGRVGVDCFEIVTKLPPQARPRDVPDCIERSLGRLRVETLAAVLVHRFEPTRQTLDLLAALREDSRVGTVGVSLYYPWELEWLLAQDEVSDVVQVPFSVVDQRFASLLGQVAERGVAIHARSAFLQGILLLDEERIPQRLAALGPTVRRLREIAAAGGLTLPGLLLGFVREHAAIKRIVVGVESVAQLSEHVDAVASSQALGTLMPALEELALGDEDVLVPGRWAFDR